MTNREWEVVTSEVQYYKDPESKWRWRVRGRNGEVFAASHQGFATKWGAKRNYRKGLIT